VAYTSWTSPLYTGNLRVYYCTNCNAGTSTVTVTNSSGASTVAMGLCEWSGAAATGPVDVYASTNHATSSTGINGLTAGPITTTQTNDMVFAFATCQYGQLTDNSTGFTALNVEHGIYGQDHLQTDSGSITPSITTTNGPEETYAMISIAFKHR
jgi:hypothetical protein